MNTTDKLIAMGFWSQLVLLILVDWGSLYAFWNGMGTWYHYLGFATVNIVLLTSTYFVWGWMRQSVASRDEDTP